MRKHATTGRRLQCATVWTMFAWLFSDPLPVGSPAPEFSLPDDSGHTVSLASLRGKSVVLVFYPGDDTPGCTRQLCQFRDDWSEAVARGMEIFGVNPQGTASHVKFRRKFNFPFPLLVDAGQKVAALYHANGLIVKRTVYRIGPDGVIQFARRGMPSPKEVLS
ncbi:MAG TPA: peroxiredoxin [Bryobacteraceae bacterium]|nr:peroxiredoxin [Bryobacteraceae bacterium]